MQMAVSQMASVFGPEKFPRLSKTGPASNKIVESAFLAETVRLFFNKVRKLLGWSG